MPRPGCGRTAAGSVPCTPSPSSATPMGATACANGERRQPPRSRNRMNGNFTRADAWMTSGRLTSRRTLGIDRALRGHSRPPEHEPSDAERKTMQRGQEGRRRAVRHFAPGSWERLRLTGTDTFAFFANPSRAAAPEGFFISPTARPRRQMPGEEPDGRPGSRDREIGQKRGARRRERCASDRAVHRWRGEPKGSPGGAPIIPERCDACFDICLAVLPRGFRFQVVKGTVSSLSPMAERPSRSRTFPWKLLPAARRAHPCRW